MSRHTTATSQPAGTVGSVWSANQVLTTAAAAVAAFDRVTAGCLADASNTRRRPQRAGRRISVSVCCLNSSACMAFIINDTPDQADRHNDHNLTQITTVRHRWPPSSVLLRRTRQIHQLNTDIFHCLYREVFNTHRPPTTARPPWALVCLLTANKYYRLHSYGKHF